MNRRPRPVTAVIATLGERRDMLARAVRSVLGQRTEQGRPWPVEVIVVFDRAVAQEPEEFGVQRDEVPPGSGLRCITNTRTAGLAGGRNTGILAATRRVIGFCDDDDLWLPGKLAAQQRIRQRHPEAMAVGGGMRLFASGGQSDRTVAARVEFADLLRSRVHELHPSSLTFRRDDLLGDIGLVDEDLPHGYGEDYDLVLRAARLGPVRNVTSPVVGVSWERASYFDRRWARMADGLTYLLRKFPEFEFERKGLARIAGQIAFARAAAGARGEAFAYARSSLRRDPAQLRAWAALLVAGGLVGADTLTSMAARGGRGL